MRHYAVDDEVKIRLARDVRDWATAGLITPEQALALQADLATPLRRTGVMLRLGLAGFTVIAGAGLVGLALLTGSLRSELAASVMSFVLGAAALAGADAIVRTTRLYRHGVEEALAMGAVVLIGFGAGLLGSAVSSSSSGAVPWLLATGAVAGVAGVAYRRFGFQYAAVMALCAIAVMPLGSDALSLTVKRFYAAVVFAGVAIVATRQRRDAADDVHRADLETIRAASVAGLYLALNVVVPGDLVGRGVDPWVRWISWVLVWLLPVAVGRLAVMDRDPLLLRVAIAAGLATLLTNKSYLGWARQPWGPMVLGVVLVGLALVLRRWLSSGPGGERHGFTARPLVASDDAAIQIAGLAATAMQPTPVRDLQEPKDPTFSGGRSGGAGAGGTF